MRTRAFAFIFTFFFAGPLFAQTTQTPPPDSAQRLHTREGFWFSAGLGYGTIGCNDCDGDKRATDCRCTRPRDRWLLD